MLWCAMLQRLSGWFLGLNLAQKVLAVLFAALVLFSASHLVSTAVLPLMGAGGERAETPSEQSPDPGATRPEASQATPSPRPDMRLKISSARWDGEEAIVEGTWEGEVSSVHCDQLEGVPRGSPRTGGTARLGRRWTGRGGPSARNSS